MRYWFLFLCLLGVGGIISSASAQSFNETANRTIIPANNLAANGTTSDDAALAADIAVCSSKGGELLLPPGNILLTGTQSITLQNCALVGAQIPAGNSTNTASDGTTILLTSTTTPPFYAGSNWSMSGINFYWPNQTTGNTVYPPLIQVGTGLTMADWFMDHVTIVNAYDGLIVQNGRFYITNSSMYAVHDLFQSSDIGDTYKIANVHFTPGPWNVRTNHTNGAALDVAAANNTIFHLTGSPNNLQISDGSAFAWRYAFYLDASAVIGISTIDMTLDNVGTIIDASSGGSWTSGVPVHVQANCQVLGSTDKNTPCFNMGNNSVLWLDNSTITPFGSFFQSSGSSLRMNDTTVTAIGQVNDGSDYYLVDFTATVGGSVVKIKDSDIQGLPSSVHAHGIYIPTTIPLLLVQNTRFSYLNDVLTGTYAAGNILTGDYSGNMTGTADDTMTGNGTVLYSGNWFQSPPHPTVASCGTSPTITGGLTGRISVGSGTVTSWQMTLPFVTPGIGSGNCSFYDTSGILLSAGPSGTPSTWTITSSTSFGSTLIQYACPGAE